MMHKKSLSIPIVLGTARKGRKSELVARYVLDQASQYGFRSELVDVRDYATPMTIPSWEQDDVSKRWSTIVRGADALILVTPEYNHGYPGELKLLLDRLYDEYTHLSVGICAVSAGGFGGVRVVEHLLPVLIELHMVPVGSPVYFSHVGKLFGTDGTITDPSYAQRLTVLFDAASDMAQRMHAKK